LLPFRSPFVYQYAQSLTGCKSALFFLSIRSRFVHTSRDAVDFLSIHTDSTFPFVPTQQRVLMMYSSCVFWKWQRSAVPGNVFKISKDKTLTVQHADPIPITHKYVCPGSSTYYSCLFVYVHPFSWVFGLPDDRSFGIVNYCASIHCGDVVVFERATCSGRIRINVSSRQMQMLSLIVVTQ